MMYACEEWVELKPENSVTFENAFDTEKDIEAALFGRTKLTSKHDLSPVFTRDAR